MIPRAARRRHTSHGALVLMQSLVESKGAKGALRLFRRVMEEKLSGRKNKGRRRRLVHSLKEAARAAGG